MPEPGDPLRLAELLCARIAHDLGGMIGTLAGALELTKDPAVAAEALALAQQAAVELRQRLELQRASWGPDGAPLTVSALRTLAQCLPQSQHCTIQLAVDPDDTEFSSPFARVLLNLLLLAADSLNGTGTVTLAGTATDLVVAIAGPRAAWPAGFAACLANETAAWTALNDPRSLQMPLTVLLARALGLRLSVLLSAGPAGPAPPLRLQEA
jgi:histidine phosphotransferase ChpT